MTDLTDWLTAQIGIDEQLARGTGPHSSRRFGLGSDSWPDLAQAISPYVNVGNRLHIARWDPARVLAECAAKRDIIALHQPSYSYGPIYKIDGEYQRVPACAMCVNFHADMDCENEHHPCPTLRLLAAPYASAPGYQPEWAPQTPQSA